MSNEIELSSAADTGQLRDQNAVKTWADVRAQRDQLLQEVETLYNFDSPESLKNAYRAYKQELRDLPETYKDLEDLNEIIFPNLPSDHIQKLTSRTL